MADFNVDINDAVRPYPVLNTRDLIAAPRTSISDPALRGMPFVSAIDQLTHTDDAMINFTALSRLPIQCYRAMLQQAEKP
jgi:hypothetical protein